MKLVTYGCLHGFLFQSKEASLILQVFGIACLHACITHIEFVTIVIMEMKLVWVKRLVATNM